MQQPFVQEWHNVYRPTFGELIGLGYVYGAEAITVGGHIEGLGVSDGHVAFYDPILPYPDPLTAETVYLVSSSSSDTMQVEIEGIDTSGLRSRSRVNLTGTTPVPAKTIGAENVGTIYCSINNLALPTTVADKIQCVIEADVSIGFNPEMRAADNEVIFIHEFDFSTDTREEFDMRLEVFRDGAWERLFRYYSDSNIIREYKVPLSASRAE
jgi:hypothetical protein